MIRTPVCDLLHIEHPIALGGMGSIYAPDLVSAVSNAGGLGAMGCHGLSAERIRAGVDAIRAKTNKPFALNFLLFCLLEESFAAALALRPTTIAFAWPRPEQDLKPFIDRAHQAGAKVTPSWPAACPTRCARRKPAPTSSSRKAPKAAAMWPGKRACR